MNTLQDDAVFPTGTISGNVKYHSLGMPGAVGTFKASITRVNAGTLEWRARFTQWRSAVSFFYWWERVFSPGIQELALPVVDRLRVAYLTHSRDRQDVEFNVEYTLKPLISRLFPMGADAELPVSVVELADSPIASLEREKGDALDYPAVALLSQPNLTELTDAEADLTQRIYNVLNAALHDANVNIPTNVRNQWMGDLGLRDLDLIGKQQDIQRLIQYVPYLIPAPVSDAQLNTLFTRLTDLVDQENLTRALLALDLLRVKTTPIPPASLKTKAIRALYESDSADYNLSYLPPAEEAAARVIPRDALVEMEGALQQYAEIQRIAMEYVARARDHWYERVASARLTLVPAFEVHPDGLCSLSC
jgi:hypothetical protein